MSIGERLKSLFGKQGGDEGFVAYENLKLPPRRMRLGSMPEKADETYVNYAKGSVRLLEQFAGAKSTQRIVDIGCGPGRLLIGMQARWGEVSSYRGIDVDHGAIEWARRHLADPPIIEFYHINVQSSRYNPDGASIEEAFELPLEDKSADLVVLFSVFSHMFLAEIDAYLKEIGRILSAGGKVLLTAFVEEGVDPEAENPDGYLTQWRGPVHCVRLNKASFEDMSKRRGFDVEAFEHRKMASGQSLYVLSRAA